MKSFMLRDAYGFLHLVRLEGLNHVTSEPKLSGNSGIVFDYGFEQEVVIEVSSADVDSEIKHIHDAIEGIN